MPIIVAFISQKGGVGKSALARALAAVVAHAKLKVMIADLDAQQGTTQHWHAARRENKIAPAIGLISSVSAEEAIAAASECDVLVLDAPGHASPDTLVIARAAHLVVLPTGASVDDLHPTVRLLHELVSAAVPRGRLVVAISRTLNEAEEQAARSYIEDAGHAVLPGSIPERAGYRIAHNSGRALTEAGEAMHKRADALIEALLIKIAEQLGPSKASDQRKTDQGNVA